jgi:CheY-like chemotaxis protein
VVPSKTILVVDDEPTVVETFERLLAFEGYTTIAALDVEAGLDAARRRHPDAIILDLRMPAEDGLSFLRRLRIDDPQQHIPVAIVTGDYFIDHSVSDQLRSLGAEICFKPLWSDDLIALASRLVH